MQRDNESISLGAINYDVALAYVQSGNEGGSLLVCKPSEATKDKELPVISAHANVLDGLIDEFRLDCSMMSFQVHSTSRRRLTLIFTPLAPSPFSYFLA